MALPTVSAARVRMVATATLSADSGTKPDMVDVGEMREKSGQS